MQAQLSIFIAAPTGFLIGVLLSMPVGPVNLTIINGAAQRGFKYAFLIGLGATTMDVIYCTIAFTSFSSFFYIRMVKTSMEVFTFVFMLFLGLKFLSAKTVTAPTNLGATASRIEKRIDEKLHPHSAYMIGFARVLGNLNVLLFWIVAAAYFMSHEAYFTSHEWVEDTVAAKVAFITGVALGASSFFCALSYIVARRGYGRFNEHTLVIMQRVSGFCLVILGLYSGGHLAWQLAHLARHRIQ
jgi:threonine/homoserine/homoserine lactone efflux protein